MKKQYKLGLVLASILLSVVSINTFETAYSQEQIKTEAEKIKEEDIKVNKETLEKAEEFIKQKNYQSALSYLNAYINSKPKKYQAYKLRGEVYYALRQYQSAIDDFQQAVDLKTEDDKFITGTKVISAVVLGADKKEQYQNPELGNLYGELMYAQKAVNNDLYEVSYKKALEYNSHMYLPFPKKEDISKINCPQKYGKTFNPQGIDAEIASVIDDIEKGTFVEAVYKLPKITSEYPDYYMGHYLTGVVMYGLEHNKEAIESFNRAIALNPNDFESFASLGKLYYTEAEKRFDSEYSKKSIEQFKKALDLNPNCNTYHYYIGLNSLLIGEYDTAIESFKKAIVIKNNDYNSKYYKAIAQYLQKDYNGTIEEATGLLYRRVSNYNSVLYLRALSNYRLKNYDSAIADIEKIHHNMDDIYNLDIKKLSQKEQTLESYLYYLQSKIARDNGLGAKSDLEKAYHNPLIALLDTRSNDYEHSNYKLTSVDIDNQYDYLRTTFDNLGVSFVYQDSDYKIVRKSGFVPETIATETTKDETDKIENTSEFAQTEQVLPTDEITAPNQTVTLTDDKAQNQAAVEPDTKLEQIAEVTTEEIKQAQETVTTEEQDINTATTEEITTNKEEEESIPATVADVQQEEKELTQTATDNSTEEKEIISQENNEVSEKTIDPKAITDNVPDNTNIMVFDSDTIILNVEEEKTEPKPQDYLKEKLSELRTDTPDETKEEPAETSKNTVIEPIKETVDTIEPEAKEVVEYTQEIIEQTTEKVKEITNNTEGNIKTPEQFEGNAEQVTNENTEAITEKPELRPAENMELESKPNTVENVSKPLKVIVNEKHADVNLDEFDVKNKRVPELNNDDEVVFFEPESFIKKAERKINENINQFTFSPTSTSPQNNKENGADITENNEDLQNQKPQTEKTVEINITPETNNIQEVTQKEELTEENQPEIIVDEITPSVVENNINATENTEKKEVSEVISKTDKSDSETPDYIQPDESVEVTEEIQEELSKKKKNKIKKSNDNLIIAVSGNSEDYIPTKEQTKKKTKKDKKDVRETPTKSIEQTENKEELKVSENIEKTKKQSFWKRLFSRNQKDKNKTQNENTIE